MRDFGKLVGVSGPTINDWEKGGIQNIKYANMVKLCKVMRTSIGDLFDSDSRKKSSPFHEAATEEELSADVQRRVDAVAEAIQNRVSGIIIPSSFTPSKRDRKAAQELVEAFFLAPPSSRADILAIVKQRVKPAAPPRLSSRDHPQKSNKSTL